METNKIPARADVPEKDKWAIQDLFATDDDWRAALAKAKEFIPRITAFRGRLAESGAALLSFFRLDDEISLAFDALVHYAQRRSDEDTRVAAYQEMVSQVTRFAVEIQSAAAFETPELLAISDEDMNRLYAEAPELELYRLNIDRIRRRREHVLSDKEEAILAAAGEMAASPDDIYSMLNDADLKFPDAVDKDGNKHPVTHGTFIPLMQSYDRRAPASPRSIRCTRFTTSSATPRRQRCPRSSSSCCSLRMSASTPRRWMPLLTAMKCRPKFTAT